MFQRLFRAICFSIGCFVVGFITLFIGCVGVTILKSSPTMTLLFIVFLIITVVAFVFKLGNKSSNRRPGSIDWKSRGY